MADDWKPIETAPKDGTRILVWSGAALIATWAEDAEFGRFYRRPGWQIFACEDGFYSWAIDDATHRMPLPEAP